MEYRHMAVNIGSLQNTPSVLAISGVTIVGIVIGAVLLLAIIWGISTYNGMVRKRQSCKESWSDIDAELKRRHDLIPNLVNTVKGYAAHESGVLEEVTRLRDQAVGDEHSNPADRGRIESQLGAGLGKLIARAEAYPDLKASENFVSLQKELSETETRIERARRFYNSNVRLFQNGCQVIPSSVVASMGGFKTSEFEFFKLDDPGEAAEIDVDFDSRSPGA
jgi:LemA protein